MLKSKMEEPFTVYKMLPRCPIPLSGAALQTFDVNGSLLIIEKDSSSDFFDFFHGLVSCVFTVEYAVVCKSLVTAYTLPVRLSD